MACSLQTPCGGVKHLVLVLDDRAIYECLAAHTLRVGADPPKWQPDCVKFRKGPRYWRPERPRLRRSGNGRGQYCRWGKCRAYAKTGSAYCAGHQNKATGEKKKFVRFV